MFYSSVDRSSKLQAYMRQAKVNRESLGKVFDLSLPGGMYV